VLAPAAIPEPDAASALPVVEPPPAARVPAAAAVAEEPALESTFPPPSVDGG
jgi:hypothetical protein